jgi:hypothetical protein
MNPNGGYEQNGNGNINAKNLSDYKIKNGKHNNDPRNKDIIPADRKER